ncbi:hypothetical protein M153_21400013034 [Pseudoloma neurophilia]|uniref:Uncharacterized protein n=1 Tax=Pseudoloma neurophilia TaxID=146866 RepID=A0A0R0LYZ1_9MICR|nr:hypothetical protein M153_21400013034 [Pseudoloma neurophilia]
MDDKNKKITRFERITMGDCICKPCGVTRLETVYKNYPGLSCYITCKTNGTVKHKCSCYEWQKWLKEI